MNNTSLTQLNLTGVRRIPYITKSYSDTPDGPKGNIMKAEGAEIVGDLLMVNTTLTKLILRGVETHKQIQTILLQVTMMNRVLLWH